MLRSELSKLASELQLPMCWFMAAASVTYAMPGVFVDVCKAIRCLTFLDVSRKTC